MDMFRAGKNKKGKNIAKESVLDAGFGSGIDFGKADKVEPFEKLAF
jgi:hypothetical protein